SATPRTRIRLRVLNAASRRFYRLGFAYDQVFHQIASDGGLLPAPVPLTRLELGPAERAEIVVDLSSAEPAVLQSFPLPRGFGGRGNGGPAGQTAPLLTLQATPDAPLPVALPTVLN